MTATSIQDRVARALDDLGPTADAVADRLRALGIKGDRSSECSCPVAVYLGKTVDQYSVFEVAGGFTHIVDSGDLIEVPTPRAVSEFIDQFDAGVHLDLVETPAVTR